MLWTLSGKLFISVVLVVFSGVFSCPFIWNNFLCLLILLNFLCLCDVRWNSYLSRSWRGVLVWECLYTVCVCPAAIVGELDLMWTRIMSFPRMCWQLSSCKEVGMEMEAIGPVPGVSWGFSTDHLPEPPYWGCGWGPSCWSRSPEGWVWAGCVPFKCVYCPLPALFPLSQRGAVLEQEGLMWVFGMGLGVGCDSQGFQMASDALPP